MSSLIRYPDFEKFRDDDGDIDLHKAVEYAQTKPCTPAQAEYLGDIISLRPIKSRQMAAFIVATLVRYDQ